MKKGLIAMLVGLSMLSMTVALPAWAGMSVAELQIVTDLSVKDYVATTPGMQQYITGFKTWQSGDDAKVKIYMDHNGMTMDANYVCHMHGADLECHIQ